jgi:hypothetical protein
VLVARDVLVSIVGTTRKGLTVATVASLGLEDLLDELRRRRWTLYIYGPKVAPELVAAVFNWNGCADVLLLRSEKDATAYRVPSSPGAEVFNPSVVAWQYHSSALWTLRAILTLDPPGHRCAPTQVLVPDGRCFLPEERRRQMTIRPTSIT